MPLTQTKPNTRSASVIKKERRDAGEKVLEMQRLLTGDKKDFTESEQAEWVTRNKAYDALNKEFKIAKRSEAIAEQQGEADDDGRVGRDDFLPPELLHLSKKSRRSEGERIVQTAQQREADQGLVIQAWMRRSSGLELKKNHKEACQRLNFNPNKRSIDFRMSHGESHRRLQQPYQSFHPSLAGVRARQMLESRGFGTGLPDKGGVLTMPTFVQSVELAMLDFSGMLQVAELIPTDKGGEFKWPTGNDTSNTGRRLNAAGTVTTDTTSPFAAKSWFDFKYSSDLIKVEQELLEDSFVDLPSIIAGMLGERLGRISNTDFTTGNGGSAPEGIITGTSAGKTTASSSAFTAKELIDFQHSVDPAYRSGAGFMMHDAILAEVRKLQDSQNRFYINFIDGLREGVPDRLLGCPIYINQAMDSTLATTKKIMLFGQLNKYKVRRVNAIRLYRLQERYRDTDEDGFVAFIRQDGKLLQAGVAPVKQLVMV